MKTYRRKNYIIIKSYKWYAITTSYKKEFEYLKNFGGRKC